MVASPLAAALIAAVGVGADGAVGGAHRGELSALILVWGREGDAGRERQGLDLRGGELVRKTEKQVFFGTYLCSGRVRSGQTHGHTVRQ